jgi:hypothetical protein
MFDEITKLLEPEGGAFGLSYNSETKEWMAALEWGREAPDSPMAGAAAYGLAESPAVAVETALKDAGVEVVEYDGFGAPIVTGGE